jgi:hypothetical protein
MNIKIRTKCKICNTAIQVSESDFNKNTEFFCDNCITLSNVKISKVKEPKIVERKSGENYSKDIEFQLTSTDQKLAAVMAQGEVFASKGGVDLMITEFVENSFDAIKTKIVQEFLDDAISQMNFSLEMQKIASDKYRMPVGDFNEKYPTISREVQSKFEELHLVIIKTIKLKNKKIHNIIIKLNDDEEEVSIIDSGTGVEHPLHICEQPFVSLKTGEDYSTGKFGRGSQVFRVFCEMMEFISSRKKNSEREQNNIVSENIDVTKIDTNFIHIEFPHNYPGGKYGFSNVKEYNKLSNQNSTGTIVVLKKWKGEYYSQLSKHQNVLERRLQHHFGLGIQDSFKIKLTIRKGKKVTDILPKTYEDEPKIQGLFPIDPINLRDELGNICGKLVCNLYKTNRSYSDQYKEPFLVINGRPLGDTTISDIPELSRWKEIWKSNFVTGYIECNELEPNQMRIGLALNFARRPFLNAMKSVSIDLKKLNTEWKNELSEAKDITMMNEVVDTVSRFLSKKGMKFNFKNPIRQGIQKDLEKSGDKTSNDFVSNTPGSKQGFVLDENGEVVQVPPQNTPSPRTLEDVVVVPRGDKKKEGDKLVMVKVKRSLVVKGGRKVRKAYSGPDLDFSRDEDCDNELSYFEPEPPTVMIQSEHPAWKKLAKKARDHVNNEKIEKEKNRYMLERYLWEIMNNQAVQNNDIKTDDDRKDLFWTYYHDLTDTR